MTPCTAERGFPGGSEVKNLPASGVAKSWTRLNNKAPPPDN